MSALYLQENTLHSCLSKHIMLNESFRDFFTKTPAPPQRISPTHRCLYRAKYLFYRFIGWAHVDHETAVHTIISILLQYSSHHSTHQTHDQRAMEYASRILIFFCYIHDYRVRQRQHLPTTRIAQRCMKIRAIHRHARHDKIKLLYHLLNVLSTTYADTATQDPTRPLRQDWAFMVQICPDSLATCSHLLIPSWSLIIIIASAADVRDVLSFIATHQSQSTHRSYVLSTNKNLLPTDWARPDYARLLAMHQQLGRFVHATTHALQEYQSTLPSHLMQHLLQQHAHDDHSVLGASGDLPLSHYWLVSTLSHTHNVRQRSATAQYLHDVRPCSPSNDLTAVSSTKKTALKRVCWTHQCHFQ